MTCRGASNHLQKKSSYVTSDGDLACTLISLISASPSLLSFLQTTEEHLFHHSALVALFEHQLPVHQIRHALQ